MKIAKFHEFESINESIDDDVYGLADAGLKAHGGTNRKTQYFYDYYSGRRISGMPKYELNNKLFEMAKRKDDIGIIAQFCLQIEREGIAHDYDLAAMISKLDEK